jgi:hypothetical protein
MIMPHLIRYWLTPPQDSEREEQVKAICTVYKEATARAEQGGVTVSTDIDYNNRMMAKPFKWTYQGKALTI